MERYNKFVVVKCEDIEAYLTDDQQLKLSELLTRIRVGRLNDGKLDKNYVVVADNWPMYEQVWKLIEDWVDAAPTPPQPQEQPKEVEQVGDEWQPEYCGFNTDKCGCQYAIYRLQVTDCGGEWDSDNPPKLFTLSPTAKQAFQLGVKMAAENVAFSASQADDWDVRQHLHRKALDILALSPPAADMVVISREEYAEMKHNSDRWETYNTIVSQHMPKGE